ncbi:solute carrier family 25 member 32-like [Porites lutea]|uniref:solute carrier family 25 member 32-like n=1 Tax=Porites lutea TaxID=51062 RepID=UPI003CC6D251
MAHFIQTGPYSLHCFFLLLEFNRVLDSGIIIIFAATATHPYQVVRSRLQNYYTKAEYNGAVDFIRKTFRYEGLRGYYKGLVSYVLSDSSV